MQSVQGPLRGGDKRTPGLAALDADQLPATFIASINTLPTVLPPIV